MSSGLRVIAVPLGVAAAFSFVLLFARSLSMRIFRAWAGETENRVRIYRAIREPASIPSIYWCVAAGLYLGMAVSDLPARYVFYFNQTINVVLVFSMSIAAANILGSVFRAQVQRLNIPISTTALAGGVLRGSVIVIGLVIILGILGISIAPLITALGVGGLAVALALQDTLANLFAGFHLLVEKSIRVGDFIRLESGHEGRPG
jgi:small-conductance mechanosensitive channel